MNLSEYERHQVDRKYRARVVILLVTGCLGLWIGLGLLALHTL
jgi:predicted metal-binding membrane protein